MKTKMIGEILDAFLDKYPEDEILIDPEALELYQSLKRKVEIYGIHWWVVPQGRTLMLLNKLLPEIF